MLHDILSGLASGLLLVFASLPLAAHVGASDLTQEYCSSQNTASGDGTYNLFQSNGECHDNCASNYAFAVVQDYFCWCSNYAPSDQQDVSNCSQDCPGYPAEKCGMNGTLYGYIALTISPSGTMAASSAPSSAAASSASPTSHSSASSPSLATASTSSPASQQTVVQSVTVLATVTQSASVFTSVVISTQDPSSSSWPSSYAHSSDWHTDTQQPTWTSESTATTTAPSSSDAPSTAAITTPVTSTRISTISGSVVTQTVTLMPTAAGDSMKQSRKAGLSGGAIAGIIIGVVLGIALIAALFFYFCFARPRRRSYDSDDVPSSGGTQSIGPRRNTSVLSRVGLLEKMYPSAQSMNRNSYHGALDAEPTSPVSDRRNSRPLFYDQRLNPTVLMAHENGSRNSMRTLDDTRDYTRALGIRNPDPSPSFETER